jgi:hypothetical protein
MKINSIDIELARSLLLYAPELGGSCLVWKVGRGGCVKKGQQAGGLRPDGYWQVILGGRAYLAHRLVWAIVHGEDAPCQIDHIYGHSSGNNIENLRLAPNNHADNQQNRRINTNNSSGHTGVSWNKNRNRWQAHICVNNRLKHLGLFPTKEEAIVAYAKAKAALHAFQPVLRECDGHLDA